MQTKRFEPYLKDFILLSQTSFNTNEITYLSIYHLKILLQSLSFVTKLSLSNLIIVLNPQKFEFNVTNSIDLTNLANGIYLNETISKSI